LDYVLDSSVALKWHFKEKFSEEARGLLPRLKSGMDRAFAPELLQAEFAHVLRTRRFQHQMSVEDVWDAWAAFLLVPIEYVPIGRLMVDAFALANDKMISSYDAVYLRLAINLDTPLLTTDGGILDNFASTGRAIHIANFASSR
jgi:predicted nucleic acid-binding protein